jgi:hypothetical protein
MTSKRNPLFRVRLCLALLLCFLVLACASDNSPDTSSISTETLVPTQAEATQAPRPLEEKIEVPVEKVSADLDISAPPGTRAIPGPGVFDPLNNAVFEEPVKPIGHIRNLRVADMPIEVLDTELRGGTLQTADGGTIEFLLFGPSAKQLKIWTTSSTVAGLLGP